MINAAPHVCYTEQVDNSQDFPCPVSQPSQHKSQAISRLGIILIDFTNVAEDQKNQTKTCCFIPSHKVSFVSMRQLITFIYPSDLMTGVCCVQCECESAVIEGNTYSCSTLL